MLDFFSVFLFCFVGRKILSLFCAYSLEYERKMFLSNGCFFKTQNLQIAFTLNSNIGEFCSRFGKFFQSPKRFVCTHRIHFWQPRQKNFVRRPKTFRSTSENDEKIFFSKKKYFSSICSSGQVECSFDNFAVKFSTKGWKLFAQCPKMIKKNLKFLKKIP